MFFSPESRGVYRNGSLQVFHQRFSQNKTENSSYIFLHSYTCLPLHVSPKCLCEQFPRICFPWKHPAQLSNTRVHYQILAQRVYTQEIVFQRSAPCPTCFLFDPRACVYMICFRKEIYFHARNMVKPLAVVLESWVTVEKVGNISPMIVVMVLNEIAYLTNHQRGISLVLSLPVWHLCSW